MNGSKTVGFDSVPVRHPALTVVLLAGVVTVASGLAVAFKESALWVVERYADTKDATEAAGSLPAVTTGLVAAWATLASAGLSIAANRYWPHGCGLEAVAATARGEDRRISLRATMLRGTGVWLMLAGLVPIGRESAILEVGGAFGSTVGRRFRGQGAAMAAAGIASAFASAYHAPLSAIAYLEEHLGIRGSRRAVVFSVFGAIAGFAVATQGLGSHALLPDLHATAGDLLVAGVVSVVPATVAARVFLELRSRAADAARARRPAWSRWALALGGSVLAGLVVSVFPLAAGNGTDALGRVGTSVAAGAAIAVAMCVGKAVGANAVFVSGSAGGAFMPSISVAAGTSLLATLALDATGVASADPWAVAVLSGTVAVAVGLRAPVTAVFLVPEMMGHMTLVPATVAVVVVAVALDRVVDAAERRRGTVVPDQVHDEDG